MRINYRNDAPEDGHIEVTFEDGHIFKATKYVQKAPWGSQAFIMGIKITVEGEVINRIHLIPVTAEKGDFIDEVGVVKVELKRGTKIFFTNFEGLNVVPSPGGAGIPYTGAST
jgi:hypothetical protein